MSDVDIVLKIIATIPLAIRYKLLLVMVDFDIGPRPATIYLIIQVTMVD